MKGVFLAIVIARGQIETSGSLCRCFRNPRAQAGGGRRPRTVRYLFLMFICVFMIVIVSVYLSYIYFLNIFDQSFHFLVLYYDISQNLAHSVFVISVQRFSIVNSAIVKLAKLAIFCINIYHISTQNQNSFRIAIVYLYKIQLVWPLLWCCYAGCQGEKYDFLMAKNCFENGFGFYESKLGGKCKKINSQPYFGPLRPPPGISKNTAPI